MKKHLFIILALTLFVTGSVFAQKTVTNSYVFSTGNTTYGGDLGLSYTTVIVAGQDNATSGLLPLPFIFNYLGQTYTHWSVTSNGLITLGNIGSTPLTGLETSNLMAASTPGLKIAPYWDDISTGNNGYVKWAYYSGTMYINFRVTVPKSAGATNAEFQVRLSANGGIGLYYGTTVTKNILANSGLYSIGIGVSIPNSPSCSKKNRL